MAFTRRESLRLGGGALATLTLPGCGGTRPKLPPAPTTGQLIDVHCHLFNGTDLPITRFLTRVALKQYEPGRCDLGPMAKFRARDTIEDPTVVEVFIKLMIGLLLGETPTAAKELARIREGTRVTIASDSARVARQAEAKLTAFLSEPTAGITRRQANAEDRLRTALRQEVRDAERDLTTEVLDDREVAARLARSRQQYGNLYRWILLFFRSRQSLAEALVAASKSWGREPLMLVPLMVDYAHWLGETTTCGSSFPEQVAVFGELSRRSRVPLHGMVAYDPLRAVFWKLGKHSRFPTPEFDPLDLAETALTKHGFLGLKLYPPMGFRPTGNSRNDADYPADAVNALQPNEPLGLELDRAMARAFDFCLEHDAPMIAHARNSNMGGLGYGRRAEPRYWIDVLRDRPKLRLCLGHQGNFCWRESAAASDVPANQSSWEWTIGRYIRENPQSHLYMDISYLTDVVNSDRDLSYIRDQFTSWINLCDPGTHHILYGTDWIMVDKERGYDASGTTVLRFLAHDCKLTADQIDRIMWQNAMRYIGLDSGKTRKRLLKFYGSRRPDWTRIKLPPNP